MSFIFNIFAKIFKRGSHFFEKLAQTKKAHEKQVQQASVDHDMAKHPDEPYYASQYLYWIKQFLPKASGRQMVGIDLGCGQGRLTIPLSQECHRITGVDFTLQAIESARKYASQANCLNTDFIAGDITEYVRGLPAGSMDFLILTEVVFFLQDYRDVLKESFRVLKSDGVAFISFRSQLFDILYSIREQKWDSADMAIAQREGYLWGGSTWFSWQTKEDVEKLLKEAGFGRVDCVGIGVCSGIEGDPWAGISRPSLLDAEGQKRMMAVEIQLARQYVNQGRYILAIAKK